jgi:hypothetical protein
MKASKGLLAASGPVRPLCRRSSRLASLCHSLAKELSIP